MVIKKKKGKKEPLLNLLIILNLLIVFITLLTTKTLAVDCAIIDIVMDKSNNVNVSNLFIKDCNIVNISIDSKYKFVVVGFDNRVLYQKKFAPNFYIGIEPSDEYKGPTSFETNVSEQLLYTPFTNAVKEVNIMYENQTIKRIILGDYLCKEDGKCEEYCVINKIIDKDCEEQKKTIGCGDSVCEGFESYKNCPEDCPSGSKDGYCDRVKDLICDPDCKAGEDPDCKGEKEITNEEFEVEKNNNNILLFVSLLFIFIILVLFIIIGVLRRKPKSVIQERAKQVSEEQVQEGSNEDNLRGGFGGEGNSGNKLF